MLLAGGAALPLGMRATARAAAPARRVAAPPLGWNSFDSYGASVTEAEVRANAEFMAERLARHGWRYVVVDFCWSHPSPGRQDAPNQSEDLEPGLAMDGNGRLLPAVERFPSAAGGAGFGPLAAYVHSLGLRFGIHVMRGIPRQAVAAETPVLGASANAAEVADLDSTCDWLNHMFGLDMRREGAQAYYDSVFRLYASWGVDYVKVDDISSPYRAAEIEGVRRAIDRCGRPMVLSLSPGPAPLAQAAHLVRHADLWRISEDLWDDWAQVEATFPRAASWAGLGLEAGWPDADMLPLGRLSVRAPFPEERRSRLAPDEQTALVTLFAIFRSPLMFGGDLPTSDPGVLALLTNDDVLAVNQTGESPRQVLRDGERVVWRSDVAGANERYVALFNLADADAGISVDWSAIGLGPRTLARDLWAGGGWTERRLALTEPVPAHGARLFHAR
jgi:alpha-galactosidase